MQKIGPCKFSELPQHYRDSFESGIFQSESESGQFFPYQPSFFTVPIAIFLLFLYIIPVLSLLPAGFYNVYQDPTLVPRIINEMRSGVLQFLAIITLFGLMIWVSYLMLDRGLRSLKDAIVWIKTKRTTPVGKYHYGLLLDNKNIILRNGNHFADFTCAFVPKSMIKDCFLSELWVEGAKRSFYINVVKLWYLDEKNQINELILKEEFSMSAPEMCDRIKHWI